MRAKRGLFYWVWSLTRVSLVILLLWMWLRYLSEQDASPAEHIELKGDEAPEKPASEKLVAPTRAAAPPVPSAKSDDLTRIKGIGPKTAKALQQAGIASYQELAESSIRDIRELLEKANYRLLDPTTWVEQARLAANGKWDELEKFQGAMKTSR